MDKARRKEKTKTNNKKCTASSLQQQNAREMFQVSRTDSSHGLSLTAHSAHPSVTLRALLPPASLRAPSPPSSGPDWLDLRKSTRGAFTPDFVKRGEGKGGWDPFVTRIRKSSVVATCAALLASKKIPEKTLRELGV